MHLPRDTTILASFLEPHVQRPRPPSFIHKMAATSMLNATSEYYSRKKSQAVLNCSAPNYSRRESVFELFHHQSHIHRTRRSIPLFQHRDAGRCEKFGTHTSIGA